MVGNAAVSTVAASADWASGILSGKDLGPREHAQWRAKGQRGVMERQGELSRSSAFNAGAGGRGGMRETARAKEGCMARASGVWGCGAAPVGWQTPIGGEGVRG